jgi:hypothetical protein
MQRLESLKKINITKDDEYKSLIIPNYYLYKLKQMCQYDIDLIIELSLARIEINKGNLSNAKLLPYFYLLIQKTFLKKESNGTTTLVLKFYNYETL